MKPHRGFADAIRHRRKELGLTLSEVAARMGWSVPYVSELERGVKQPPPAESVERLAAALLLDPESLNREAELSRRSVELDLEGAGLAQRQLAVLLARRLQSGMTDEEARDLLERLQRQKGEPGDE